MTLLASTLLYFKSHSETVTTVFIQDLQFHAYHGITASERQMGHRFRLDIFANVEESAQDTDQISETVDYASMAQLAVTTCQATPHQTVEHAAKLIGEQLLAEFPRIESVRVSLAKIQPAIEQSVEAVGVEIELIRTHE